MLARFAGAGVSGAPDSDSSSSEGTELRSSSGLSSLSSNLMGGRSGSVAVGPGDAVSFIVWKGGTDPGRGTGISAKRALMAAKRESLQS